MQEREGRLIINIKRISLIKNLTKKGLEEMLQNLESFKIFILAYLTLLRSEL
jgi:hypothetical protein